METRHARWVKVAAPEEVAEGAVKEVSAGARRVVVARHDGNFYAFQAECPHMGGPLGEGTLVGSRVDCPWHHYLYDLATGENYYPKSVYPAELKRDVPPLKTFPVRLVDGRLEVQLSD